VKVNNFGMVNLIAGSEIVPELIQANFTAENVVEQLQKVIPDGGRRAEMIRDLAGLQSKLRDVAAGAGETAIARAAQNVRDTLHHKKQLGAHWVIKL
jgi:lipid A disaccharide synthetase